jgi:signal transduction histidine kinase
VFFLGCRGFFVNTVQKEIDGSLKLFFSLYESPIKLEQKKFLLNSIYNVFGCNVKYASFVSLSGESFFVGKENILKDRNSIYEYSLPVVIDGKPRGTLFIGFCRDWYNARVKQLYSVVFKNVLFAIGVCVVFSVLMVFLISKYFTKSFEAYQERFKDDFLGSVSHEFKSPMAAINGYSDLVLERVKKCGFKDKVLFESLNVIKNSVNRLKYFVNNVLNLANIRNKNLKVKNTVIYMDEVIEKEAYNFKSVASLEKKMFVIDVSGELPPVFGDANMLGLAVSSILGNAFKFTKEGDRVAVKAMLSKGYDNKFVEVWISDTGIGIPEKLLKKIFEKFYQIRKSKFEKLKGSGLGLSLASEIISLHHGTIWAESKVGEGTTVKFVLPVFKV